MNEFYKNVSETAIKKMIEQRDFYLAQAKSDKHPENKTGYILMADFYDALIVEAQKHIADHKN
jgi:hypothetical protein